MKDPVRNLIIEFYDGLMIGIDELRFMVWNPQFWTGTITFAAMVVVVLMEGCLRRGA